MASSGTILGNAYVRIRPDTAGFESDVTNKIGGAFKKVAGIAAAAFAGGAVLGGLKDVINLSSNAEQSLGGVQAVFKGYADTVIKSSKEADRALGLSGNSYRELATLIGSQLKNAGVPMDKLGQNTDALIKQGADLSAMFGGTTQEAVQALSSALKGEMDPIEKYGISLNQAALKAEAMSLGLDTSGPALSNSTRAMAVMSLVTKQAADAQGAFARENDTAAGRAQRAAAQWENLKTSIGDKLLPAWSALMDFVGTRVLPGLQTVGELAGQVFGVLFKGDFKGGPFAEDSPFVNALFLIHDGIAGIYDLIVKGDFSKRFAETFHIDEDSALVDFLFNVRDALKAAVDFIKDHAQPILAGLGAALAVIAAPAVIAGIGSLVGLIGTALAGAFGALLSPVALTALAVGGIVAIFVQAYKDSEPLRDAVQKLKDAFGVFFDAFDKANGAGGLQGFFDGIKAGLEAAGPMVLDALGEMGSALWSWISDNIGPALLKLGEWLLALDKWFYGTALPAFYGFMLGLGSALVDWIGPRIGPALAQLGEWLASLGDWIWNTGLPWLVDALGDLGQALVDWIGPRIVPMLAAIATFLGSLADWLWNTGLPWLVDRLQELGQALVDWIGPRVGPMLKEIGKFLGEMVGWLLFTGLPMLVGILLVLGEKLISWILPRIPELLANLLAFIGKAVWWLATTALPWLMGALWDLGTGALSGLWNAFKDSPVMQAIFGWFGEMLAGIGRKWDEIKATFLGFVDWVVDTFWNNGLMKVWNWINDIWNGTDLKPIHIVSTSKNQSGSGGRNIAMATGGILPGYSPGRDIHSFFSPTGGRLDLSGGEAVMRPEFTRAMGTHGVNMLNQAARSGGASAVARVLAAQNNIAAHQAHKDGGVIDLPGWLDWVPGAGFVTGIVDKINDFAGGGVAGDGVLGLIKTMGSKVWDTVKDLFGSGGGGDGYSGKSTPNGARGLGPAAQRARDYVMRTFGISNIGGFAARNIAGTGTPSDHSTGHAIDVMIANYKSAAGIAQGTQVAEFFRTNPQAFGTKYVIWRDRIANGGAGWTPYRHPGGGNSDTLQHRDHVHVSVFDKGGILAPGMTGQNLGTKPERVLDARQTQAFEDWMRGDTTGQTPLIGGDLVLQVGDGASVRDQMEEAMFQLRRIKRGGGIR